MILLTGGTGFLGSYLLLELLQQGGAVRAIRRSGSNDAQVKRVLKTRARELESLPGTLEWVEGDILDVFSLEDAMKGCDTVVHCAGMVSFNREHRHQLMEVNAEGTANVVNASLRAGVGKLLYISSIAAFGRGGDDDVISETSAWKTSRLNSRYAVSKYNGEKEAWRGQEEGLSVAVLNPAIILGHGDPRQGTNRLFETVEKGLHFYPSGVNGFVDARDVAKAAGLILGQGIYGEKFILSAGNLSYRELFSLIAKEIDKKPPTLRAGRLLASLAWRLEAIRSLLTGRLPLLTRETAMTASRRYFYDGTKITTIGGFKYTTLEDCLHYNAGLFRLGREPRKNS